MSISGLLVEFIRSAVLLEADKDAQHPAQYGAPQGSKRDKQLDKTKEDLESGDRESEACIRPPRENGKRGTREARQEEQAAP